MAAKDRGALILNEVLPSELREALERGAEGRNVTLNDVAGKILSMHFMTEWEDSGKPYRPMAAQFKLRVPEDLHLKIKMHVAMNKGTVVRGIVLSILASHYSLAAISPTRRPRSAA